MKKAPKKDPTPRIGRKDQQDPDRESPEPRDRVFDHDDERSDRDAGAGRPVQLDEDETPRRPDPPRPTPAK